MGCSKPVGRALAACSNEIHCLPVQLSEVAWSFLKQPFRLRHKPIISCTNLTRPSAARLRVLGNVLLMHSNVGALGCGKHCAYSMQANAVHAGLMVQYWWSLQTALAVHILWWPREQAVSS